MRNLKLTTDLEQCLRDQVVTADQPGPILHDFGMLLEFLGPKGVEVGGKYNLLPIKFIAELDARLSRPLHLDLKRPQLRSHPYLQGLHLLLRASGLTRVEGAGAKARLVLDPAMRMQWDRLNPTEQYFNLLEAWFRFGRPEMVGERGSYLSDMVMSCLQVWRLLPKKGELYDSKEGNYAYLPGFGRDYYMAALMDLFGLIEMIPPTRPVTTWHPGGLKHVPFGDAVFTMLAVAEYAPLWSDERPQVVEEDEDEKDEEDEDELEMPQFGVWQPLFQPYFPEWRENLVFPEPELREGEYIFRVSLGKVWRLIAISSDDTLDDLADCILRAVKFDDDHLYEFVYRDRFGAEASVMHPQMEEGPWTDQVPIGTLPLEPGQTMQFHFDFGDDWRFTVKLERIDPPPPKARRPRVLESHGKAPAQYPNWDE